MRIEPASVDQIRLGSTGRIVEISKDAGGVADDLKKIDPHLKVRFAENGQPPFWAVYWESDDQRSTYLVTTAKAYQGRTGIWTGLDGRLVERIRQIDPQNGYDYASELERQNRAAAKAKKQALEEKMGPLHEQAAHAVRKDLK